MFFNSALCIPFVLNFLFLTVAQDCRTYGQSCSDDYSCCGGCCLNAICKDTYLDCRTLEADPCIGRYCPADQVCFTYQPPGCKGCGPLIECRTVPIPDELRKNKTLTHHHTFNSSVSLMLNNSVLSLYSFILGLTLWL